MSARDLNFVAPPALNVAEGAASPNPGIAGVAIWSTAASKMLVWSGAAWLSLAGVALVANGTQAGTAALGAAQAAQRGTAPDAAHSDHFHPDATTSSAGLMTADQVSTLNQASIDASTAIGMVAAKPNLGSTGAAAGTAANGISTNATRGTATAASRDDHWHPDATTSNAGLMTAAQVSTLNTASSNASTALTNANNAQTTANSKAAVGTAGSAAGAAANGISTSATHGTSAAAAHFDHWHPDATTSNAGLMTAAQVSTLNTASSNASTALTNASNAQTTANSKAAVGTAGAQAGQAANGISTASTHGTSAAAAHFDHWHPDATTSNAGLMTAAQVSTLNTASSNASNANSNASTALTNANTAQNTANAKAYPITINTTAPILGGSVTSSTTGNTTITISLDATTQGGASYAGDVPLLNGSGVLHRSFLPRSSMEQAWSKPGELSKCYPITYEDETANSTYGYDFGRAAQPALWATNARWARAFAGGNYLFATGLPLATDGTAIASLCNGSPGLTSKERANRVTYRTTANASGYIAGVRGSQVEVFRSGQADYPGGFLFHARFALTVSLASRFWVGLFATTAAMSPSADPSTFTHCIQFCSDAGTGNIKFMCSGSTAGAGANVVLSDFPGKTSNEIIDVFISSKRGASNIGYGWRRASSGLAGKHIPTEAGFTGYIRQSATVTATGGVDAPPSSTANTAAYGLTPHIYVGSGTANEYAYIDVMHMYLESEV